MIEEGTDCHHCGEGRAMILCRACGVPLCEICVKLEDYGFGCDGGQVVAFCPDCFDDPGQNTTLEFDR